MLDGDDVLDGLRAVTADLDAAPALASKVEAGVAARRGEWEDVVRLAQEMPLSDSATEVSLLLLLAEALIGLRRFDEAASSLATLDLEVTGAQRVVADLLGASLELGRGTHGRATERLAGLVHQLDADERAGAIAMSVSALLGVAAAGRGDVESAAVLTGFARSRETRLGIRLRPGERLLVVDALGRCRGVMDEEDLEEHLTTGGSARWSTLPVRHRNGEVVRTRSGDDGDVDRHTLVVGRKFG